MPVLEGHAPDHSPAPGSPPVGEPDSTPPAGGPGAPPHGGGRGAPPRDGVHGSDARSKAARTDGDRRPRPRSVTRALWIAGAAVVVATAGVFAACTAGSQDGGTQSPARSSSAEAGAAVPTAAAPTDAGSAGAAEQRGQGSDSALAAPEAVPPVVQGDVRQVIRTGDLTVTLSIPAVTASGDRVRDDEANAQARADAVAAACSQVRAAATGAGGYVAGVEGSGSTTSISLRVPGDRYEAVMTQLADLGEVTARTESSRDVTAELVDVQSRVDTMTASVTRVRALLAEATDIADVIAIESELAAREADLEALQRQQASLAGQVAMSTVTVSLRAVTDGPVTPTASEPDNGFVAGLTAGWTALLGFFTWLGTVLGAALPFLPLIALGVVLAWWLARRWRGRSRRIPAPVGDPTVQ